MCARLSPIVYEHINFLGRYAITASAPAPNHPGEGRDACEIAVSTEHSRDS